MRTPRRLARDLHCRQHERNEQADDPADDEQFDQREGQAMRIASKRLHDWQLLSRTNVRASIENGDYFFPRPPPRPSGGGLCTHTAASSSGVLPIEPAKAVLNSAPLRSVSIRFTNLRSDIEDLQKLALQMSALSGGILPLMKSSGLLI